MGKKVFGQGEGEEEDGVGYGEEDFFLNVGEERQKPRDGAASMTSLQAYEDESTDNPPS